MEIGSETADHSSLGQNLAFDFLDDEVKIGMSKAQPRCWDPMMLDVRVGMFMMRLSALQALICRMLSRIIPI